MLIPKAIHLNAANQIYMIEVISSNKGSESQILIDLDVIFGEFSIVDIQGDFDNEEMLQLSKLLAYLIE